MVKFTQSDAVHMRIPCGYSSLILCSHLLSTEGHQYSTSGNSQTIGTPCVYIDMEIESQQWTEGLNPCGLYYEGYTDDLQQMLTKHSSATVFTMSYGVRQSHTNHAAKDRCRQRKFGYKYITKFKGKR